MVLSILMAAPHTVGGRWLVLFSGLRIPEEPLPDGAGILIEEATDWYGAHFLLGHVASAPCALSRMPFRGLIIPKEPLGLYPVIPDGAISQELLSPLCRPGACSLPMGSGCCPGRTLFNDRPGGLRLRQPCVPLCFLCATRWRSGH